MLSKQISILLHNFFIYLSISTIFLFLLRLEQFVSFHQTAFPWHLQNSIRVRISNKTNVRVGESGGYYQVDSIIHQSNDKSMTLSGARFGFVSKSAVRRKHGRVWINAATGYRRYYRVGCYRFQSLCGLVSCVFIGEFREQASLHGTAPPINFVGEKKSYIENVAFLYLFLRELLVCTEPF